MTQVFLNRFLGTVLALVSFVPGVAAQNALLLVPPAASAPAPTSLPPRPLPDPSKPLDLIARFDGAVDLYHHFRSQAPDMADRVLALDLDPQAAFALIRDQVQSVAYDGHLRDPADVIEAGGGNAYDKALVLADLLGRMGYDTQLVQGSAPSPAPQAMTCGTGEVDADIWAATQLGAPVLARVPLRAAASYAMLRAALAPADQGMPASTQPHIWVQMRDGADWVDLDPWLSVTAYGDHPAGTGTLLQDLPVAHSVNLVLTVERLRDGVLRQDTIMSADIDVPTSTRSMIALGFGPKVEGLGGGLAEALGSLNGAGAQMVANLMINGESRQSDAFTAPAQSTDGKQAFLGTEEDPSVTTALFLTVTSHVPGQPDHAETRSIIDLVPTALRLAVPDNLDPAQLLPVKMGKRYPAALESLRMIVVSNGAASPRLAAAVGVQQLINLADFMARSGAGLLDGWDMLWGSWAQANRIELAAETLFRARPAHNGACAVIDRPRVLISGLASAGGDKVLQWLDWTIDDYGISGGDAPSRAEMRLWHGTLQAALEKEALMQITLSPDDLMPVDTAPMQPLTEASTAALGQEAAQDRERGYVTLASANPAKDQWWRVNPQTGAADARALMHGNSGYIEWGAERALGSLRFGNGTAGISEAQEAYLGARNNAQLLAEIRRDLAQIEAAAAKPRCGGNEYLILETCVSIPISVAVGVVVSGAIAYAMLR